MKTLLELSERGLVPDPLLRFGTRHLIGAQLRRECRDDAERASRRYGELLEDLRVSPSAMEVAPANRQHCEVPERFFRLVLGPRLKHSACYWPPGVETLADAESAMLELYARRAGLENGMRILDLGCGWGAFTLWAAARYPCSSILAISSSVSQKQAIDAHSRALGLDNVRVWTADVDDLQLDGRFDRVISIEMFERTRNYSALLEHISGWLVPHGKLFVHIFCHRHLMYRLGADRDGDWMMRHCFTGGLMPARDTLLHFQDRLRIERRWELSGEHYGKTARAWLDNLDAGREAAARALGGNLAEARRSVRRWRMFFIACEELFGWRGGSEWLVAHYLFRRRG